MAEKLDLSILKEMLNEIMPADLDAERVFQKMIQPPYHGRVSFRHLKNMDPDDFNRFSDVETIKWFRRYPSKFVLFEDDKNRVRMCGVRIPSAKICLQYLSADKEGGTAGCTDEECYKFHICRKFMAGYCKDGPSCSFDHHFQSDRNRRLLAKQALDKYSEEDLLKIFVNSQLRVCDAYNKSRGFCQYDDSCMRLHVCKEFVCGKCAGGCGLSHSLDDSEHTKRLRRYYALDDKPQQEVLRNLLIVRRRPDGATAASGLRCQREDVEKLLQFLAFGDDGEVTVSASTPSASTSSETKPSLPAASAAQAPSETSPAVTGSDADSVASWQLEVFGAWRTLSDTESAQIEKAYCDPNNDTMSLFIVLTELGGQCHLVAELNTMTASLVLDDDESLPCEKMKLRRTNASSRWSWYWQHNDCSWRSYSEVEGAAIEAKYQQKENKFRLPTNQLRYKINLSKMTQINSESGRVRFIRRRPKFTSA